MSGLTNYGVTLEANTAGEEKLRQLEALIAKIQGRAQQSSQQVESNFSKIGNTIRDAISNPAQAAAQAWESLLSKMGTSGMVLGVVATAATAAGAAVYKLASDSADLAEQQDNMAARLGVTAEQYGYLSQAAKEAGVSADAIGGIMRGLSKALSDNGDEGKKAKEALSRLGIEAKSLRVDGDNMLPVFTQLAERIGQIPNAADRADAALKIFGKGGLELIPVLNSRFADTVRQLEAMKFGLQGLGREASREFDEVKDAFGRMWSDFTQKLGGESAQILLTFLNPNWRENRLKGQIAAGDPSRINWGNGRQRSLGIVESFVGQSVREGRFESFMMRDPEYRLNKANEDLKKAIDDMDEAAVRRAKAAIAAAKAAIEANKNAAELRGAFRSGMSEDGPGGWAADWAAQLNSTEFAISPETRNLGVFRVRGTNPTLGGTVNTGFLGRSQTAIAQQVALLQQATEFQARKIELMAGPGGELQAAQQIAALRLSALQQEIALTGETFALQQQKAEVLNDLELRRLTIIKQREQTNRATGGSIFDSITAGGGGIGRYAAGLGLGFGRTIFSNAYSMAASGLDGKLSLTNNPNGFLGRLLNGTPFGADPLKMATDLNTQATMQNTAALMQMATGVVAGGGGAGLGRLMPNLAQLIPLGGGAGPYGPALVNGQPNTAALIPLGSVSNGTSSLMRNLGIAGTVAAGGFGIYSGVQQGGARGALSAIGSAGGMTAGLAALIPALGAAGPIGAAVAIGAMVAMAVMGDPKKKRAESLASEASRRYYGTTEGAEYTFDTMGRSVDYGSRGEVRIYVQAMDSKSFIDNAPQIAEAVRVGLGSYPPLVEDLRGALA